MPLKSLVVVPNWVGDTVMALPTLGALAASDREVWALARPHLGPLLSLVPAVHQVVERAPSNRQTLQRVAALDCREAVVLPNSFRAAWIARKSGIPRRWGYRGDLRAWLLDGSVPRPPRAPRHQTADFRELLTAMEVSTPETWVPRLEPSPEIRERGRSLLERAHLDPERRPLIGLFAGAEFGPSKRWPWQRFAELTRTLRRESPGATLVLLAGPQEVWLAVRIHEESGKIHPVVGPDLDLADLTAVLSHLDLLVTNDSGPMHLAAALDVSCVALFGPTDPRRTAPAGGNHRVLYGDRWCSPCFRRRCPLVHHRCLRRIGVDQVADACRSLLERAEDT